MKLLKITCTLTSKEFKIEKKEYKCSRCKKDTIMVVRTNYNDTVTSIGGTIRCLEHQEEEAKKLAKEAVEGVFIRMQKEMKNLENSFFNGVKSVY